MQKKAASCSQGLRNVKQNKAFKSKWKENLTPGKQQELERYKI